MMVNDPRVVEGTGGTTTMTFTVGINAPVAQAVTVDYQTADYTAKAGSDYTACSGTLTFAPGQTIRTVQVPIATDAVIEPNEYFFLRLSGVTNALLADASGLGAITDDDTPVDPMLSITNPRVVEGNSGTTQLVYTLSLNKPVLDKTASVKLSTFDGSARAGLDYQARSGVVTFAPGETTKQFAVTVYGNTAVEATKSVYVSLSEANVKLAITAAIGLILNDD